MTFVFRKIDHKSWWRPDRDTSENWLPKDELRADALQDLKTENNALSVYLLSDDESALDRVIAACAGTRNCVNEVDYVLVDSNVIGDLDFTVRDVLGRTPDDEVNKWHRDLCELSATKLLTLALTINKYSAVNRRQQKEVGRLLNSAVKSGFIDPQRLDPQVRQRLNEPRFAV